MLNPDRFDTEDALPSFMVSVERFCLFGRDIGTVDIPVTYNEDWSPIFDLGDFATFHDRLLSERSASFRFAGSNEDVNLLVMKTSFSDVSKPVCDARLQIEPAILGHSGSGRGFKAVIVNPPNFLSKTIILRESDFLRFEIIPFGSPNRTACALTSAMEFGGIDPLEQISNLVQFLTFVKGTFCGVGNLFAFDSEGSEAFQILGFTRNDKMKRQTNWFDIEIQEHLPEIYGLYSVSMTDSTTRVRTCKFA